MKVPVGYVFISATVLLTVFGQLVVKWRVAEAKPLPSDPLDQLYHVLALLLDPFILAGMFAAVVAALCWMAAISRLELSHAYPFVALSFVLVTVGSGYFFNEAITLPKVVGVLLIVLGVVVSSRG